MANITTKEACLKGLEKVEEFIKFLEWCAIPDALKEPKTQKELAIELKVEGGTLSDWKQRKGFYELLREERKRWGRDRTQNVIAALYRKAVQNGDAAEAKLWLQYFEDYRETTQVDERIQEVVLVRGEIHDSEPYESVPQSISPLAEQGQ